MVKLKVGYCGCGRKTEKGSASGHTWCGVHGCHLDVIGMTTEERAKRFPAAYGDDGGGITLGMDAKSTFSEWVAKRLESLKTQFKGDYVRGSVEKLCMAKAALEYLFDNRMGDDGLHNPWAPREFWADAAEALYGPADARTLALRKRNEEPVHVTAATQPGITLTEIESLKGEERRDIVQWLESWVVHCPTYVGSEVLNAAAKAIADKMHLLVEPAFPNTCGSDAPYRAYLVAYVNAPSGTNSFEDSGEDIRVLQAAALGVADGIANEDPMDRTKLDAAVRRLG